MKISYQWLKDYVSVDLSAEEFAHKLTMAGLEVENITDVNGNPVFEIEVTPNRPDCLNMIGIAREVSAIFNKEKKVPQASDLSLPQEACDISIEDSEGCSRYIGTIIQGVSVSPPSQFVLERIAAVGMRSINNVVDITNFCLMEIGQPLHAFDYDKLAGGKIIVRRAKKGEKIVTIDDVERELDPSILVIADAEKPVAIAGVMGGKDSEVTENTKNVLLESAYFDSILIRRASRKLGLSSDASYRFERGVDYQGVEKGSLRALGLILESAQGTVTKHFDCVANEKTQTQKAIAVNCNEINHFLGASLEKEQCLRILQQLDFQAKEEGALILATPPSFRNDIKQTVDIIEEIARVIGYDNLPYSVPKVPAVSVPLNPYRQKRARVRGNLVAQGFNEIITYTMISKALLQKTNQSKLVGTDIVNPLTVDQEILRPSLLSSLLNVAQFNINRGEKNLKLFETGKIYLQGKEQETLAVLMTGETVADWRVTKKGGADFFDIKGAIEQLLQKSRIKDISYDTLDVDYFEDASVSIHLAGKKIGEIGNVSDDVLSQWSIKQKGIFYAEINLDAVYAAMQGKAKFIPISEYPSIVWDVSLAVNLDVSFQRVQEIALAQGGDILKSIEFKEEYVGEKIAQGKRGIIFSLTYQSSEKTLTESEVSIVHDNICKELIEQLEAVKR